MRDIAFAAYSPPEQAALTSDHCSVSQMPLLRLRRRARFLDRSLGRTGADSVVAAAVGGGGDADGHGGFIQRRLRDG